MSAQFKSKSFRGAFKLHEQFREAKPTRAVRLNVRIPKTLMQMGHVEYIGYRTTHGKTNVVHYHHDFAPGSRPMLAAGPGRNELFILEGRYHVTDRGIVDLDRHAREIDDSHNPPTEISVDRNPRYTLSEVLAAAYPRTNKKAFLVHAVTPEGTAACGSVKPEHLAEYTDPKCTQPTCKKCLRLWEKA